MSTLTPLSPGQISTVMLFDARRSLSDTEGVLDYRITTGSQKPARFFEMATTLLSSYQSVEPKLQVMAEVYQFRDHIAVSAFLQENQFLLPLLLEAWKRIEEDFGSGTDVALEVFTDPEAEDDSELVAYILTDLPPESAVAALGRFDTDWWLNASFESKGKLCIHLGFQ